MRLLRAAEHVIVPWKNGGGVTREVLRADDPADPAQFLWRISIATVAKAGPFSRFPGIERSIAVLSGEGLRLLVDGVAVTLGPESAPFRFSGDAEVESEMVGGETTDLNAMTRRGVFAHQMRRVRLAERLVVTGEAEVTLLLFPGGGSVDGDGGRFELKSLDSVVLERGERVSVQGGQMFSIAIEPVGAQSSPS